MTRTEDSKSVWVRTCQECGHSAKYAKPSYKKSDGQLTASFTETLCKKCKSPGLDFGSEKFE